ncbi:lipopolysaccharide heptosyltransferase II [Candidatus Omnitrophota bacterium]
MMNRILIIEVNWVGDVLFTTPAIRAIREWMPDAHISALVAPRCLDMLEGNPHINEIIILDEDKKHKGITGKLALISELRGKRFDMVISFHRSMTRMLICALAGIPRRVGYHTRKRGWLLTDSVIFKENDMHRVEHFLRLVSSIGIQAENKNYEFFISDNSIKKSDEILRDAGIGDEDFFVINPGGNWLPKRWPAQRFADLCVELKDKYGKKIIITGAKKDTPLAAEIIRLSNNSALSICAKTTLKELGAVLRRASLVVANDSGPMHIAASQRTPTVAIFGPTSPKVTGPYGSSDFIALQEWSDCPIPCYAACEDYRCIEAVTVEDVMEAVGSLLEKT